MPVVAHEPTGLGSLVPRVGGDDLREERAGRLDVVVVTVHPGGRQLPGLGGGEDAGRDGDVEPGSLPHHRGDAHQLVHDDRARTAHREHDAELARAKLGGLPRRLEDLLDVKERCCLDRRVELGGLGAEMTVLRAPAGLRREDPFDLDLGTAPGKADLVGEGGQHRHRFVRQRGQRRELRQAEREPLVDQLVAGGAEEGARGQHRAEPTGDGGSRVSRVDAGRWPTPAAVIGG